MQIEFSPMMGFVLGVNYAYYEPDSENDGLHLVQFLLGIITIQVSWNA